MPIRPENKGRYPANWVSEIRPRILARAGNCCEGSPMYPDCRVPDGWYRDNETGLTYPAHIAADLERRQYPDWGRLTRIVLTIAHLNHVPEDCRDENLRAWCQRCHCTYDAKIHAQHANETRRKRKALKDLFEPEALPSSGEGAGDQAVSVAAGEVRTLPQETGD